MKPRTVFIITSSTITAIGAATLAWWSTTASFTLFKIGYLHDPLEQYVDVESMSSHYVDLAVADSAYRSITESQDKWQAAGSALGLAVAEQLKPALKAQNKEVVEDGISEVQKMLDRGDRSFFKSLYRQGNQVIVRIERNGESSELVMSRESGQWMLTQFTDKSVRDYLARQPINPPQQPVEPRTPAVELTPTPVSAVMPAQIVTHTQPRQYATLRAKDRLAQINIREQPNVSSKSYSYGVVGDRVKVLDRNNDSAGQSWFRVYFEKSDTTGWVRGDFIELDGI